jgi:hypothetical protein
MEDGLYGAGAFTIDELRLVTTTGLEIDLITSVMGITLYEGIKSTCITGTVMLSDAVNLASYGPILGQEYLYLKIRTPSFKGDIGTIDFSENVFLVNSLSSRQQIGNGVQAFVLSFVSQELVRDQRSKVTQSLEGSWSDIVSKMLLNPNYLGTRKRIFIENTSGVKKFVAPNVRPLDIIRMATEQGVSNFKNESTFLFYETLKGFHYRTLASMYNEKSILDYTTVIPGSNIERGIIDVEKDMQTILEYEIISNSDSIVNYRTGVYGSKLIVHDILSKSFSTQIYNYHDNFINEPHIVSGVTENKIEHPTVSSIIVDEEGHRVSDFAARTFLLPTSKVNGFDSQHTAPTNSNPYTSYQPEKWVQRRNSSLKQLDGALSINIKVHGNTLVNVGDKVMVNIPNISSVEGERLDKFFKGPFLVKTIRHDFIMTTSPKTHEMSMNLVKDSLEKQLDSPTDNREPKSDKSGGLKIVEYF